MLGILSALIHDVPPLFRRNGLREALRSRVCQAYIKYYFTISIVSSTGRGKSSADPVTPIVLSLQFVVLGLPGVLCSHVCQAYVKRFI